MNNQNDKLLYKMKFRYKRVFLISLMLYSLNLYGQENANDNLTGNIYLGAYYFDGWTAGSYHITDKLKEDYQKREPIWGWVTSAPKIVEAQIDAAANAGIKFFSFDWYFRNGRTDFSLNNALNLYLTAPNKNRLKFCLMVANHEPFLIGPSYWNELVTKWISLFKTNSYLKVNGKPLLIFFSVPSLIEEFGTPSAVKHAFDSLRLVSKKEGLKGVTIAACVYDNDKSVKEAEACGFDILTGYNYHGYGLKKIQVITPIDTMRAADIRVWDGIKKRSDMPYIPVATLNWDPRPWRDDPGQVPHFTGYSLNSVYQSVRSLRKWIEANPQRTSKERIALMYAWNENGEGGWLTPSKIMKDSLLLGVKSALQEKNK